MSRAGQQFKVRITPGVKALDFVLLLPAIIPNLQFLEFTIYSPTRGAKSRISKSQVISLRDKAKEFLRNDANRNRRIRLSTEGLADRLLKTVSRLSDTQALGINSKCWLRDGSVRQIPMMDFKPKPGPANINLIKQCLIKMGQSGVLLESGASYHFYGFTALDQNDWISFLGDSLLAESSDSRWIGHSILQRYCVLRVTSSELKRTTPVIRLLVGQFRPGMSHKLPTHN